MFVTDSFSGLNFVIEFNLPKDISDNQEHIKLSVDRVEVPAVEVSACPLGCIPMPIRTPGEIHCIARKENYEHYKYIKQILTFINKWVNSIYCPCNNLQYNKSNLCVEAKLYAYKNDHSLLKKLNLVYFAPLFNPDIACTSDDIELIFKFENILELEDS